MRLSKVHIFAPCILVVFTLTLGGCSRKQRSVRLDLVQHTMFKARNVDTGAVRFTKRLSADTGIDLEHVFPSDAPSSLLSDQCSGAGICIGDVDGDGLPDIFVTNFNKGNRLYKNLGGLRFQDVTDRARVGAKGSWCAGASFVDVDNDIDLDLSVCVFDGPNLLFINQGDGQFREEAAERGFDYHGASVMTAFADYDHDGDLDAYLVTHRMNLGEKHRLPTSTQDAFRRGILERVANDVRVTPPYRELFRIMERGEGRIELVIAGQRDYFYENDGLGRFRVVNDTVGIDGFDIGLAASWWDYDDDGWSDLYVSSDYKGADRLYRNNGDGTFTDVALQALPHVPWFSMGNASADINNDGRIDLLATDMSGTTHARQKMAMGDMQKNSWFLKVARPQQYMRNSLFLNTGTSRLFEIAQLAGVANSDWTWSPLFADFDNDGWVDLFIANGMSRDFMDSDLLAKIKSKQDAEWRSMPVRKERNLFFRNEGNLKFSDVSESWGISELTASYGSAISDLDRDGDLDLVVANFSDPIHVYENNTGSGSITVALRGESSNRFGIGAKVQLQTVRGTQTQTINSCQGFMSAGETVAHFGLSDDTQSSKLLITWPNGRAQQVDHVVAGRQYTIAEDTSLPIPQRHSAPPQLFGSRLPPLGVRHVETPFDDFLQQPLLPAKMSQQGPGLAVGDLNADGVDDLFLSGAAGQSGQILLSASGEPEWTVNLLPDSRDAEQLAAAVFDWDNDGDRDIYVVSGGVESSSGQAALQDRLYVNDGNGSFQRAIGVVPEFADSGSCVAAADYDRDGDIDLFVGARVVPGQYPMSPTSRLLRNDGDKFVIADELLSSDDAVAELRRVTSAVWSDANNDGWVDLLVTQHWGPIRYFENRNGRLIEVTKAAGLSELSGWWNGISSGDVDSDGDTDFVVTNQGLNTKYHATAERPTLLYYGDFVGQGTKRIVEATYEDDILYPDRGRSCSTAAMPTLAHRFGSFRSFATATLQEVYSPDRLDDSLRLSATTLETGVLVNDGDGVFAFQPLPRLAQASPSFGAVIQDVDGDGCADIYLVQNSHSPQAETGWMAGSMSLLLRGDGHGGFVPVGPKESGLVVPGDGKSLSIIDLNQDHCPDFVVGVNDAAVESFQNRAGQGRGKQFLRVTLRGRTKNTDAIGARFLIEFDDGSKSVFERTTGGGYLSQSSLDAFVGRGQREIVAIDVRWPNGSTARYTSDLSGPTIVITE